MNVQHGPSCHTLYGKGYGNVDSDVVFVGIAPGKQEERQGKPFVGPSGKFLNSTLGALGLNRDDYYFTNLVCWVENEPNDQDVQLCWERLVQEIKGIKPKVIVAIGTKPMEWLIKGHTPGSVRGYAMWSDEFQAWVIGTWHPSFILQTQSENLARDFLTDLSKIGHYLTSNINAFVGNCSYRVVEHPMDVNEWLSNRSESDFLTLDVETTYDGTRLRSFAMAQGDECIVVKDPMNLVGKIDWPLDKRWTFQNLMFDVEVIDKFFGVKLVARDDTMYMSYVLDERAGEENNEGIGDIRVGIHGLKKLAGAWLGSGIYDINTETASDDELWPYNAKDAVYTYRLATLFYPRMEKEGVQDAYQLTINAANRAWQSRKRGIYVNRKYLAALGSQWIKRWLDLEEQLRDMAYILGWPQEKPFNPNSHPQLKSLLYDVMQLPVNRNRGKNTQAKTLQEGFPDNEFVKVLLEWRALNKDIGTYVRGIMEAVDENGYIHPNPILHATVTARWAYSNPPMQTIPQLKNVGEERAKLRRAFTVASADRELAEGDYEQSEVHWAAHYGNDAQMKADLASGDFHAGVTESVFKIKKGEVSPEIWSKKRGDSKYVTFGVMFGRQKNALHKEEMKEYALEEVGTFIQNWYERYKGYIAWRMGQQKLVREKGEQQSLSGHKRRYPIIFNYHAFNQAFNFPVQCVSHANLMATYAEAWDTLVERWDAYIVLEIHDALVIDYPKKYRDEVLNYVKEVAERNRYGISVPMTFKYGDNLRDMVEYGM